MPRVMAAMAAADAGVRVRRVTTAEEAIAMATASPHFVSVLLGTFAALALLLAVIGLYGVLAYSVRQRTREMGVRLALGAQPRQVLALVMRDGLGLAAAGLLVGIGGALVATRAIRSMLFGVQPFDPTTLVAVACCLGAAAVVAAYLPARRAARLDPVETLRAE